MKIIDIRSLPVVEFAHIFEADTYSNSFRPSDNFIEVSYVSEGSMEISIGNERFIAEKNDLICLVRSNEITINAQKFHSHHTVGVNVGWTETDCANAFHIPFLIKSSPETYDIAKMIDNFIYKPYLYENSLAKSATEFMNILYKINEISQNEKELTYTESYILAKRAKKYIHLNLHKPITQKEVAEYLDITPQHLCNIFKKSEGMSLIKYVNNAKLRGIQSLMEKENLKLYEASQLFGFSDANYVSHLYKKTFGKNITSKPNLSDLIKHAK